MKYVKIINNKEFGKEISDKLKFKNDCSKNINIRTFKGFVIMS